MNITSSCCKEGKVINNSDDFQQQINRLFYYPFFQDSGVFSGDTIIPRIDIHADAEQIYVKAELPGMEKENIDVTVEDGQLIIRGEKKQEKECNEKSYLWVERYHGTIYRAVDLPAAVDASRVKATYKNGVLDLVLPRREEDKPKQIKIDVT